MVLSTTSPQPRRAKNHLVDAGPLTLARIFIAGAPRRVGCVCVCGKMFPWSTGYVTTYPIKSLFDPCQHSQVQHGSEYKYPTPDFQSGRQVRPWSPGNPQYRTPITWCLSEPSWVFFPSVDPAHSESKTETADPTPGQGKCYISFASF